MKKKKGRFSTIILILVFVAGLSLLLYPSFSDYWNSLHQTRAISNYAEEVAKLDDKDYKKLFKEARNYNKSLLQKGDRYHMSDAERKTYEGLLNVSGNGIIGYIEIPVIDCSLPVYHGTEDTVLQIAIGHIEGSSLPVGGAGSHCVLSGHRGLPSAKLFSDLDKVNFGDVFMLCVLNKTLTYEVDQILIVEPHEVDALNIEPGKDYCTLVTCTPYGINSHRLLVRGHRVKNLEDSQNIRVTADAMQIEPLIVAPVVAIPMLLALLIVLLRPRKKSRKIFGGDPFEDQ